MFKLKNEAILRGPFGRRYRPDNPSKVCLLLEIWNAMDTAVATVMNSSASNNHNPEMTKDIQLKIKVQIFNVQHPKLNNFVTL